MIGTGKSFFLMLIAFVICETSPSTVTNIIAIVALIYFLINAGYAIYNGILCYFVEMHRNFTLKKYYTGADGRTRYGKDFLRVRVGGAILFWFMLLSTIICFTYIRPVSKNEYRIPKVSYEVGEEVVIKTGPLGLDSERKVIESVRPNEKYIDAVGDNPIFYVYTYTDGTSSGCFGIKGSVQTKKWYWVFDCYRAGAVKIFKTIYCFVWG